MKNNKKERKVTLSLIPTPEMIGGKIQFDKDSGTLLIFDKNKNKISSCGLVREHFYNGKNRRVLLSKLVAGSKIQLKGMDDLDFLATYDLIYIIDTNKLTTNDNNTHHITSFLRCSIHDIGNKYDIKLYERVGYFHFINLKHKEPEKVGWISLIDSAFFQEDINAGLSVGIIVDAHLDELDNFNDRSTSISGQQFLSKNTMLMYAKADKKDTLVNKLIKSSDELANEYKKRILKEDSLHPSQLSPIFECDKYWFLNEKRKNMCITPNIIDKPILHYGENASIQMKMLIVDDNR